jgi:hypothetical protein
MPSHRPSAATAPGFRSSTLEIRMSDDAETSGEALNTVEDAFREGNALIDTDGRPLIVKGPIVALTYERRER